MPDRHHCLPNRGHTRVLQVATISLWSAEVVLELGLPIDVHKMILSIPLELTERVLAFAHPCDVAAFAQASVLARRVVYEPADDHLWRSLFLSYPFDDPRPPIPDHPHLRQDVPYPWRTQLCARVALDRRPPAHVRVWGEAELDTAAALALAVIAEMPPAPAPSHNLYWLDPLLRRHHGLVPLPHDGDDSKGAGAQARGRLGATLALACEDLGPAALLQLGLFRLFRGGEGSEAMQVDPRVRALRAARRAARACVYDLRRYTAENGYGACFAGGAVDWTHVHAQVTVVCMNVLDLAVGDADAEAGSLLRPPRGLRYLRENSMPRAAAEDARDWAGVAGEWRRLVCFMDYRDLMTFNTSLQHPDADARALTPSFFDRPSFREATRLISMELAPTAFGGACAPGDDPAFPPITFAGRASSATMPVATMQGTVRRTRDGVVRWSWTHQMLQHGGHGWSSNGIQLGGVRSASGVIGTWTGASHDEEDPAGPFWMWKVPDDAPKLFMENN